MHFHSFLFGALIHAVGAIDILIYTNSISCEGPYNACVNLEPDQCCAANESGFSIAIVGIPATRNIEAEVFEYDNCARAMPIFLPSQGNTYICAGFTDDIRRSASYYFLDSS